MNVFDHLRELAEYRKALAIHEDRRRKFVQNKDSGEPLRIAINFIGFENSSEGFEVTLPLHKLIPAVQEMVDNEIAELKEIAHKAIDTI